VVSKLSEESNKCGVRNAVVGRDGVLDFILADIVRRTLSLRISGAV
jgi:hypothetical protein